MLTADITQRTIWYRVISPAWAGTPKSGMGAAVRGGRFNRPQQEALYLSAQAQTALAEYQQDNPWLPPGTICTYFVNRLRVVDLSSGYDPKFFSPLWADYAVDWRNLLFNHKISPPTWDMADDTVAMGLDGIIFPSQASPGGTNLVIYRSSERPTIKLDVYDPNGDLAKIHPPAP